MKAKLILSTAALTALVTLPSSAQPRPRGNEAQPASITTRMLAFDANHDGQITKDELTDPRLQRLFDRADANHDGIATKDELTALAARMEADAPQNFGAPGDDNGPGGPGGGGRGPGAGGPGGQGGGPGGGGPGGGPGGRGPGGGPPQPGIILPPQLQETLNLTDDQKKQIADLQADVDKRLASILTEDQKKQLTELKNRRQRGPGGGGAQGGPGGGGGQGGPGGNRQRPQN